MKKKKAAITVLGISSTPKTATNIAELTIQPRFKSDFSLSINAIVLSKLTNVQFSTDISAYTHLNNLILADPAINSHQTIDLLLGASEYAKILKVGLIKGPQIEPIAQNSELGWIISGKTHHSQSQDNGMSSAIVTRETVTIVSTIDDELHRIFNTDDVIEDTVATEEEMMCENQYVNTVRRENSGKYIVTMPFKNDTVPVLGESRKLAMARFFQLEKKFMRNPAYYDEYCKFIDEYIEMGHMSLSREEEEENSYFLPHHAVFKDNTTTKLRVVFNA